MIVWSRLGKFRDGLVPQIVEAESVEGAFDFPGVRLAAGAGIGRILQQAAFRALNRPRQPAPCRPPALHRMCRINVARLAGRKEEMVWLEWLELLSAPVERQNHLPGVRVETIDLANSTDERIVLETLKYLTDRAFGKTRQAIEASAGQGAELQVVVCSVLDES